MNPLDETIAGTFDIMTGRDGMRGRGLERIALSAQAYVVSFGAVALMLLIDATVIALFHAMRIAAGKELEMGRAEFIVTSSAATFAGYAAFVALLYAACRLLDLRGRFEIAVLVHNWAGAIVSALFLPVGVLYAVSVGGGEASAFWNIAMLVIFGFIVVAGFRVTRVTLACTMGQGVAIFFAASLGSFIVNHMVESFFGLA